MREARYTFFVYVGGKWDCAMDRNMSRQAACGLFNNFKAQYSTRLFVGRDTGRMIGAHYLPADLLELQKTHFPANLKEINLNYPG